MPLTASQKKRLRGLSHGLKPVVTVAGNGLSDTVVAEIHRALRDHELIKVKLRSDRDTRREWAARIADICQAEPVQSIGQMVSYYRKNPDKPVVDPG